MTAEHNRRRKDARRYHAGCLRLLQQWVLGWRGAGVTMEIVPVVTSAETREVVAPYLDADSD